MNVLVIGSGGREDAIGHELRFSSEISIPINDIFVAPGNGGTNRFGTPVPILPMQFGMLADFIEENKVGVVMVGPEQPLVDGIADYLHEHAPGIFVCGPTKVAARLEGSKRFTKARCRRWGIPTADYRYARTYEVAEKIIKHLDFRVIKADGLFGGKGVTVAESEERALAAAKALVEAKSGIVIEERLVGRECSVMAFCDGVNAILLPPARDYKRAYDDDTGPNTGGMGAYSSPPDIDEAMLARIKREIIDKLVSGMAAEGTPYRGILYVGIMITPEGDPYLLEVNCRLGDPEAQVVLSQLEFGLLDLLIGCSEPGGLASFPQKIGSNRPTVGVVMSTREYPGSSQNKNEIRGIKSAEDLPGVQVYHAGTVDVDGKTYVNGGRVLTVVGEGTTISEARERAYAGVARIEFGGRYRKDIAELT